MLAGYFEPPWFRVDFELNAIEPAVNQTPGPWNPRRSGLDHEHKQHLNKCQPTNRKRTGQK